MCNIMFNCSAGAGLNQEIKLKYRPHRGALADSMAECVDIEPTKQALLAAVNKDQAFSYHEVRTEFYCHDSRIGWDCYIVEVKRVDGPWLPFGFTDALVE